MFKNKYGEIRSGWSVALSLLVMIFAQVIAGLGISLYLMITVGFDDLQRYAQAAESMVSAPALMLLSNLLTIGIVLLLFKIIYKRPFIQMGLSTQRAVRELLMGCLFGIASISLVFALLFFAGHLKIDNINFSIAATAPFMLSFLTFILVGFCEEILSRGFMMTAFKTTRSRIVIFAGSSILFSLMPLFNPNVTFLALLNIFLVGILFAYMFVKTGRLWWPIGYHITWNFFQGNIFGMNVSGIDTVKIVDTRFTGADWITGGAFGAEGGVVVTLVILLGILFIRFAVKTPDELEWTMRSDLPLTRN